MHSNPHILVVDDDVEICRLLKQYLEKSSLRVSTVCDGRQMQRALDQAAALAAVKHTVPGDSVWATRAELGMILAGEGLRVQR